MNFRFLAGTRINDCPGRDAANEPNFNLLLTTLNISYIYNNM